MNLLYNRNSYCSNMASLYGKLDYLVRLVVGIGCCTIYTVIGNWAINLILIDFNDLQEHSIRLHPGLLNIIIF